MNARNRQYSPVITAASRTQKCADASTPVAPATPSLDSIVQAICLDANYDSLKFILRSDTGHDGE
jgi:hypothetical protein